MPVMSYVTMRNHNAAFRHTFRMHYDPSDHERSLERYKSAMHHEIAFFASCKESTAYMLHLKTILQLMRDHHRLEIRVKTDPIAMLLCAARHVRD